jgi:hypothetical protein
MTVPWNRLATIAELAKRSPSGAIGRTALMKFMYFLQTLRDVPMGYYFSLYSHGPYQSEVLADLDYAEAMEIVRATTVHYPGGYGFQIRPGEQAAIAANQAADFVSKHEHDLDWVMTTFGHFSAAELELASTIVFADRETAPGSLSKPELVKRVREIKPHFSALEIEAKVDWLITNRLLG